MKKSLHILLVLFLGIVLTGCVISSVYPFFTAKDVAFDPALVANWTNTKEAGEHWNFERAGSNAYQLTYSSDGKSCSMEAHLFRLKDGIFLDLFNPEATGEIQPWIWGSF